MEFSADLRLFRLDVGVLELNNQPFGRLDVCNVEFTMFVPRCSFLPVRREVVLPIPVPLCLIFPPVVTMALALVRPMPNFLCSALW